MNTNIILKNFQRYLKYVDEHFSKFNDINKLKEQYIKNEKLNIKEAEIIQKYKISKEED